MRVKFTFGALFRRFRFFEHGNVVVEMEGRVHRSNCAISVPPVPIQCGGDGYGQISPEHQCEG